MEGERTGWFEKGETLTFEKWRNVPYVDASGLHELPQGNFQEEDGDSANEGNKKVRDEEHTCGQVSSTK